MILSVGKWATYWYQRLTPCTIRYQIADIYGRFKACPVCTFTYRPTIKNKCVDETQEHVLLYVNDPEVKMDLMWPVKPAYSYRH